jgi:hypothetical protein
MSFEQGEVWWGPALHKSSAAYRPWVIVSTATHPYSHEECVVLAMTTKEHPEGIPVPESEWVTGGSDTKAFVSPWYPTTIKQRDFDNQQGRLSRDLVVDAIEELHQYTPAERTQ